MISYIHINNIGVFLMTKTKKDYDELIKLADDVLTILKKVKK